MFALFVDRVTMPGNPKNATGSLDQEFPGSEQPPGRLLRVFFGSRLIKI